MTRRRHAKPKPLRTCAYCQGPMPEQKPVFLVLSESGRIVGPYHAGCAEKAVLRSRAKWPPYPEALDDAEHYGDMDREEKC